MEFLERNIITFDSLTLLFTGTALIFAFLNKAFPKAFSLFIKIPVSNAYFRLELKSKSGLNNFKALLNLGTGLIITLGIYIVFMGPGQGNNFSWLYLLPLFIGTMVFLTLKYWLERLIGIIFNIGSFTKKYLFFKVGIRNFSAIITFPLLLVVVYLLNFNPIFIKAIILIYGGIQVFGLMSFYIKYRKTITQYWLYFILYICSLEIAPYFILFKLLT